MKPAFWKERWQAGQIGFHSPDVHPALLRYADDLLAGGPHRVLVPLCGKSVDLAWLAQQGHEVVGIELVRSAVEELFAEAKLTPTWETLAGVERATAGNLTAFVADIFDIDGALIGPVSRIWDRAALIALHPDQREAYVTRLREWLQPGGQVLLNVLAYDPQVMQGPPWSVRADTVTALYPEAEELGRRDALDDRWRSRGHTHVDSVTWRIAL